MDYEYIYSLESIMKGAQVVAPNTNMRVSHNPLAR